MSTALWPLQEALFTRARAAPPLTALVSGIWDEAPEGSAYPYVTLGSLTALAEDSHSQRGLAVAVVWHIWSNYRGTKEAALILAALDDVFDRQPLAVTGWTDVSIAHEQHQTVRDPDPDTRHINVRYRVWMTKEE